MDDRIRSERIKMNELHNKNAPLLQGIECMRLTKFKF